MSQVTAIYSRSHSVGGVLIRAASWWAPWCHCALVTDDDTVIEARAMDGVIEIPLAQFLRRVSAHLFVTIECPDPQAAIAWARAQVGSNYDYGVIAEFLFRSRLQSKRGYQCIELLETAIAVGGRMRFRVPLHGVTPQQSFMCR